MLARALAVLKPEYLWRPAQIFRRLSAANTHGAVSVPLPWNCSIRVNPNEVIGRAIATQGVYDLPVTEAIVRLLDRGETAVDVGANIGYMCLAMSLAAGPEGRVLCFEPNPEIIPELRANLQAWTRLNAAPVEVRPLALSDRDGKGYLHFPAGYTENRGLASVRAAGAGIATPMRRLDSVWDGGRIGLLKADVEGYEAAMLEGARELLQRQSIRDIIFEEGRPYPAASHLLLERHGYHLFRLTRSTWRPLLLNPAEPARQSYLPGNFLATSDARRALARFRNWGWKSLIDWPVRRSTC